MNTWSLSSVTFVGALSAWRSAPCWRLSSASPRPQGRNAQGAERRLPAPREARFVKELKAARRHGPGQRQGFSFSAYAAPVSAQVAPSLAPNSKLARPQLKRHRSRQTTAEAGREPDPKSKKRKTRTGLFEATVTSSREAGRREGAPCSTKSAAKCLRRRRSLELKPNLRPARQPRWARPPG